jgi:4-amino-4-deoxy-L-arabinose transferase-like glycosyltransferase
VCGLSTTKRYSPRSALEAGSCVALFLALGSAWALTYPVAEPPDELFHLMYASHVARLGRLPLMRPPEIVEVPVEGNQPPLYYRLGALALRAGDLAQLEVEIPPRNPRSNKRGGTEPAVYAHDARDYPWALIGRATRLLRLCFLPLGALVVASAYAAASVFRPEDRSLPLLAGGFAATLPQFSFIMGSVTNDALANAIAAIALATLIAMLSRGGTPKLYVVGAMGVVLGLGLTAKMTLVFLVPVAIAGLWLACPAGRRVSATIVLLAAIGVFAGPLLLGNWREYGDPFALELNRRMFPQRVHQLSLGYVGRTMLPALFFSFWGVFGHMNVHLGSLYGVFVLLTVFPLWGMALRWRRGDLSGHQRRTLRLCALTLLLLFASIVRYNLIFPQPQGRYAFPGLVVLALLFAEGTAEWIGSRWTWALAVVALMAALNLAILFGVALPAYAG